MTDEEREELEVTETGRALARALREQAERLGINPQTATDEELRPLVAYLPEEIVQDARDINTAMERDSEETERTLACFIRLMFESEARPTVLN